MATVKTFKDLVAWQRGMDLACEVYRLTADFPREETYGLVRQLRDSAVSVPSNIAEGQARSTKEFRHFLAIANGSLQELETQLLLSCRLEMVSQEAAERLLATGNEVGRLVRRLSQSLEGAR